MKKNRFLCLALSIVMLLSLLLPTQVFAEDEGGFVDDGYGFVDDSGFDDNVASNEDQLLDDNFVQDEEVNEPQEDLIDGELPSDEGNLEPQEPEENEELEEPLAIAAEDIADAEFEETEDLLGASAIVITKQPEDIYNAKAGKTYRFSVEAEGDGLTYKWYASSDGGNKWSASAAPGNNTPTIKLPFKASYDGYKFVCLIKNASGKSLKSAVAAIYMDGEPIVITQQPADINNAEAGKTYRFQVVAEGESLTYQWAYSTDGGNTWKASPFTGNKTAINKVTFKESYNGFMFKCVIKDAKGNELKSDVAAIRMGGEPIVITQQPADVDNAEVGKTYRFQVVAEGESLTYQWAYSKDGGNTWAASPFTGNKTAINKVTFKESYNGFMFKCVIKDAKGNELKSDVAAIRMSGEPIVITQQPADVDDAEAGKTYRFQVVAKGESLTYQWAYSTDGGNTWKASPFTGSKTAINKVTFKESYDGFMFKCVIKDAKGNELKSDVAAIHMAKEPIVITEQPADVDDAEVGKTYRFQVVAEGESLTYQWAYSTDGGNTWKASPFTGSKTAVNKVTFKESYDGFMFKCVIKDAKGNELKSDVATIKAANLTDGVFTYALNADKSSYTVTQYLLDESSATVPETFKDLPVTIIGESAFEGKTSLTSVDLPDSITIIGKRAFAGCTSLSSMS